MASTPIYKVVFYNQNQVYEVFAKGIYQSEMYGFVEIEEFLFGERTQIVVDPGEEKLKSEFDGVKRSYIPMHNIVRIDECYKRGRNIFKTYIPGFTSTKTHRPNDTNISKT